MVAPARLRVLVLDDDAETLELCRMALAAAFEVETLRSPSQAQLRLRDAEFQVLCVRQKLPGTTGGELCRKLREAPSHPAFVLFLRAGEAQPEGFASGVDMTSVIELPFEPSRLLRLVEQMGRLAVMQRNLASRARPTSSANPRAKSGENAAVPDSRAREPSDPNKKPGS